MFSLVFLTDIFEFVEDMKKRACGGKALLEMELKHRGMYIAHQLSFRGVTFKVDEVMLTPAYIHAYNESSQIWADLVQVICMSGNGRPLHK